MPREPEHEALALGSASVKKNFQFIITNTWRTSLLFARSWLARSV